MSNPPDLCIRITLPYQDCSGIIQQWYSRANKAVCYEHQRDEEVSKTHVHIALFGLDCKTEALKRMWAEAPGKGNEFWSFSPLRDERKYLAYMTKGTLRPVLVKNFSPAEVEEHRKNWVEPDKADNSLDSSEIMIRKVLEDMPDSLESFIDKYRHHIYSSGSNTVYHGYDVYARFLFGIVRSATMRSYWGVARKAPHTTQYKIVAASAFLRLCEKFGFFEAGLDELKSSWY